MIENKFKNALDNGKFVFLADCELPENVTDVAEASERISALSATMANMEQFAGGLLFRDKPDMPLHALKAISYLPENERACHVCVISGENRDLDQVRQLLALAKENHIANLLCVSGEAKQPSVCTGSTEIMRLMTESGDGFFPGATVNPFYYQPDTVYAVFNRMLAKLKSGAQFIICQTGWDMLQQQALSWFMLTEQLFYPLLARVVMLTPERISDIITGKCPGCFFPPDFRKLLEFEMRGSRGQFDAAQYRRLELQVAGLRLLGYSGVVISGVNFSSRAVNIAARIRSAFNEFRSFEHWLDEYNAHTAGVEAHFGDSYRLFDRMLSRPYPFDEPPRRHAFPELNYPTLEKIHFHITRLLLAGAEARPANRDRLLKKLLLGCPGCDHCEAPQNFFHCPRRCPRQLESGPCGGLLPGGYCQYSDKECIFVRMLRRQRYCEM